MNDRINRDLGLVQVSTLPELPREVENTEKIMKILDKKRCKKFSCSIYKVRR